MAERGNGSKNPFPSARKRPRVDQGGSQADLIKPFKDFEVDPDDEEWILSLGLTGLLRVMRRGSGDQRQVYKDRYKTFIREFKILKEDPALQYVTSVSISEGEEPRELVIDAELLAAEFGVPHNPEWVQLGGSREGPWPEGHKVFEKGADIPKKGWRLEKLKPEYKPWKRRYELLHKLIWFAKRSDYLGNGQARAIHNVVHPRQDSPRQWDWATTLLRSFAQEITRVQKSKSADRGTMIEPIIRHILYPGLTPGQISGDQNNIESSSDFGQPEADKDKSQRIGMETEGGHSAEVVCNLSSGHNDEVEVSLPADRFDSHPQKDTVEELLVADVYEAQIGNSIPASAEEGTCSKDGKIDLEGESSAKTTGNGLRGPPVVDIAYELQDAENMRQRTEAAGAKGDSIHDASRDLDPGVKPNPTKHCSRLVQDLAEWLRRECDDGLKFDADEYAHDLRTINHLLSMMGSEYEDSEGEDAGALQTCLRKTRAALDSFTLGYRTRGGGEFDDGAGMKIAKLYKTITERADSSLRSQMCCNLRDTDGYWNFIRFVVGSSYNHTSVYEVHRKKLKVCALESLLNLVRAIPAMPALPSLLVPFIINNNFKTLRSEKFFILAVNSLGGFVDISREHCLEVAKFPGFWGLLYSLVDVLREYNDGIRSEYDDVLWGVISLLQTSSFASPETRIMLRQKAPLMKTFSSFIRIRSYSLRSSDVRILFDVVNSLTAVRPNKIWQVFDRPAIVQENLYDSLSKSHSRWTSKIRDLQKLVFVCMLLLDENADLSNRMVNAGPGRWWPFVGTSHFLRGCARLQLKKYNLAETDLTTAISLLKAEESSTKRRDQESSEIVRHVDMPLPTLKAIFTLVFVKTILGDYVGATRTLEEVSHPAVRDVDEMSLQKSAIFCLHCDLPNSKCELKLLGDRPRDAENYLKTDAYLLFLNGRRLSAVDQIQQVLVTEERLKMKSTGVSTDIDWRDLRVDYLPVQYRALVHLTTIALALNSEMNPRSDADATAEGISQHNEVNTRRHGDDEESSDDSYNNIRRRHVIQTLGDLVPCLFRISNYHFFSKAVLEPDSVYILESGIFSLCYEHLRRFHEEHQLLPEHIFPGVTACPTTAEDREHVVCTLLANLDLVPDEEIWLSR